MKLNLYLFPFYLHYNLLARSKNISCTTKGLTIKV